MSDVPLKEYVESQIKWLQDYHHSQIKWIDKHFDVQIEAITRAEGLALSRLNERLAGMNEFRDTLREQAGQFVTRAEMQLTAKAADERLKNLEVNKAGLDGKLVVISGLVSLGASVIGTIVLTLLLGHIKVL